MTLFVHDVSLNSFVCKSIISWVYVSYYQRDQMAGLFM